jgi:alkylation response protein AidB-like acyl-CoA dehydrogenase
MATKVHGAELMTRHAGTLKDKGQRVNPGKCHGQILCKRNCRTGFLKRVYKYTVVMAIRKDYPAEKFWRDSKLCTIGEGTSEIQKLVIARNLLKN